jgi:hypothetical protein
MVLSKEERIELLEKARAVKASKKAQRDLLKPIPKKGRPAKKQVNTLNLDDVADETNVEELAEDIKNMEVKGEPVQEPELPQQKEEEQNEEEVEIVEEIVKKKKKPKKKIIRRYIEPSSDSDQEIIEEFIKKKPKAKPKISPRYHPYAKQEPEPIQLTPPTLNLFCY